MLALAAEIAGGYLLLCLSLMLALFVLWVFVNALKRVDKQSKLAPVALYLGYAVLAVGYVIDVACNCIAMPALFFELPKEYTVSERLRRLVLASGWRAPIAIWFASTLINPFTWDGLPHIKLPV